MTQQRAIETRARLVAAAAHEISHRGYAGASATVIATVADCTRGAMHFHFRSKCDMAAAVLDEAAAQFEAIAEPLLQLPDIDPLGAVKKLITELAEPMIYHDIVRAEATIVLEPAHRADRPSQVWEEAIAALVARAERDGTLESSYTAEHATRLLTAMIAGRRYLHTITAPHSGVGHSERKMELFSDVLDFVDSVLAVPQQVGAQSGAATR